MIKDVGDVRWNVDVIVGEMEMNWRNGCQIQWHIRDV